jgi:hypothetical protein
MAITLSMLSIKKHYLNIELYTDDAGKKLLIDDLNLSYSKVNVVLDLSRFSIPKIEEPVYLGIPSKH